LGDKLGDIMKSRQNKSRVYTITMRDKELYDTIKKMKEIVREEVGVKRLTWEDFFRIAFELNEEEEK